MQKVFIIMISLVVMVFQFSASQIGRAQKLVIALSAHWNSTSGEMYLMDKIGSRWIQNGTPTPVSFGRKGLAWGNGLHKNPEGEYRKHEGDERSPAGIFTFGSLYGLDSLPPAGVVYPYKQLTPLTRCVDDSVSKAYNQVVEEDSSTKDWSSAERMQHADPDYKYVLIVEHNADRTPGNGSCIFFHINKCPTSGCTSMDEQNMVPFLQWLDPETTTLLIQLPQKEYSKFHLEWHLPDLTINH